MKRDYYEVLGVARDAGADVVKQSYRRLAMKYHPDRNPDDGAAEEKFKEVREAYDVLSNPEKRAAYDRHGHAAFENGGGMHRGGGGGGGDFSSVFDDLFSDFFGSGGRASGGRQRVLSAKLSFADSMRGCKKEFQISEPMVCSICKGSGAASPSDIKECETCRGVGQIRVNRGPFIMQQTCERCQGRGKVAMRPCAACSGNGQRSETRRVAVKIPAGIQDGETIRLNVRGSEDEFHLRVRVEPHPLFKRDGDNIHLSIPVSVAAAALGGHVEAPTPSGGNVKITVPPETQTGTALRLRGLGAPNVRGRGAGDLLCHIIVETPVNLTEAQKKVLRNFGDSLRKKQDRHAPREQSWLEKAKSFFQDN